MNNMIYNAFDKIKAEKSLKDKTTAYLQNERLKKSNRNKKILMQVASTCALLVLFLTLGSVSYSLYFAPAAYIDIDVNPSIEITLNRFGRVIGVEAYNDDAALVLARVAINHKPYDEAVQLLMDDMILQGYLQQDGSVFVTVQSQDKKTEQQTLNRVQAAIDTCLGAHHTFAITDIQTVSLETKNLAHAVNLSPAKYTAIMQLQALDPTATFENCKNHSVSEIHNMAQNHSHHKEPLEDNNPAESSVYEKNHHGKEPH